MDNIRLKTCNNCKHYHQTICDMTSDIYYHLHDWCDIWKLEIPISTIPDEDFNKRDKPWYNDIETGQACCWRFEDSGKRGVFTDEQMLEFSRINREDS